jgi:3-methyl-2-oxobutanoate hydroxymethyltransferase
MLGMYTEMTPKFVKQYANLKMDISSAAKSYCEEVKSGAFPELKHTFKMDDEIIKKLY